MRTSSPAPIRRAVGIIRVSKVNGRDRQAERFISPGEQRKLITQACATHAAELVDIYEELDVSGGLPLDKRPATREAVAALEAGRADTVVVAYFDRLFRNLRVQAEIAERVERAGGTILAVDVGRVRHDTASHWLSSTMLGAVAEYHRRMTAERTAEAKEAAVARGLPPFPAVALGYRVDADRQRIAVDPELAPVVREAFARRADGASIGEIRAYLAEHGVARSTYGVWHLLKSRMVLGELSFGELVNVDSHPPIVERALWERVQRGFATRRGARPGRKSERLLAGLGLVRCAGCGCAMQPNKQYPRGRLHVTYRCKGDATGGCTRRASISAEALEAHVVERVREVLADQSATATASVELGEARATLAAAQAQLNGAIRRLAVVADEAEAQSVLAELRAEVETARARVEDLERLANVSLTLVPSADWSSLTLAVRRQLISAVVRRVMVAKADTRLGPRAGLGRVSLELAAE